MTIAKPVIVHAGLRVKDGTADEFIKLAASVVEETRKEPGCVKYELLQDVFDRQTFYFFEEYADENAYQEHRIKPYMTAFRPERERLLDKYLGVRIMSERFIS